jgi:hypothetical protein
MKTTVSLREDFKGDKDAYYNFKRSVENAKKELKNAVISVRFFTPHSVRSAKDMLDGIEFED